MEDGCEYGFFSSYESGYALRKRPPFSEEERKDYVSETKRRLAEWSGAFEVLGTDGYEALGNEQGGTRAKGPTGTESETRVSLDCSLYQPSPPATPSSATGRAHPSCSPPP